MLNRLKLIHYLRIDGITVMEEAKLLLAVSLYIVRTDLEPPEVAQLIIDPALNPVRMIGPVSHP